MGTIRKEKEWCEHPLQDENVSGNFPRCYQRAKKRPKICLKVTMDYLYLGH